MHCLEAMRDLALEACPRVDVTTLSLEERKRQDINLAAYQQLVGMAVMGSSLIEQATLIRMVRDFRRANPQLTVEAGLERFKQISTYPLFDGPN